jgi:uncharacterized repeat protein (TIGR03803 family)
VLLATFLGVSFLSALPAFAQQEEVLQSFSYAGATGYSPFANLIFDSAGNLYGTTYEGGAGCSSPGCGTVFELSPKAGGGYAERVLHSFRPTRDGENPVGGLVFDAAGNLYGTTSGGGAYGAGTVFELSPEASGGWTEKILHNFNDNGTDGSTPYGTLILDVSGNLYGTTVIGGNGACSHDLTVGCGTVFELSPGAGGLWTEKILHNFVSNGVDGLYPNRALLVDSAGNLYGTTYSGGNRTSCGQGTSCGTVFELSPKAGGEWTEKILHNFNLNGSDGTNPLCSLIFDGAGNLYGTTWQGGVYGEGTAFRLSPQPGGGWTESVLHAFGEGTGGKLPTAGLTMDAAGNLFGTTNEGGANGNGTVFELTPAAGGTFTESVEFGFPAVAAGGFSPESGLTTDAVGNLFGTTIAGGTAGDGGTVFEIKR